MKREDMGRGNTEGRVGRRNKRGKENKQVVDEQKNGAKEMAMSV